METHITLDQLQSVILQQGIVSQRLIRPEANFRSDLRYKTVDLLELARLLNREFHLQITAEQANALATVQDTVTLLNQQQPLLDRANCLS